MRVLLVDDHRFVLDALRNVLERHANVEIVGDAENGMHALEQLERTQTDVVLMDIKMPAMDGIDATALMKVRFPEIKVIAVSMYLGEYGADMLGAGADALLSKDRAVEDLYAVMADVMQ